jgi:hypothetical protein
MLTPEEKMRQVNQELQKNKIARLFKTAEKYGVIKRGWSCIDYMRYAATRHGWESTCISGQKGSLKSNLLMQHGLTIYGNMADVQKHFITSRKQLLNLMEDAINNEICIPWVGVDDIAALFPKSLYFTHRKMYSKLQSAWETVRTVMSNFEFTCVIKRKVASFILEDITGDIKCYNPVFVNDTPIKGHYDYRRWLWLRNLKDPTTDIAKLISVEDIPFPATPDAFKIDKELSEGIYYSGGTAYKGVDFFKNHACLMGIDRQDFREYWNERLNLTKVSFHDFASILEEPEPKKKRQPKEEAQVVNTEVSREASEAAKALARKRWS